MNAADERGPAITGEPRDGHPVIVALSLQVERLEREVGTLTAERADLGAKVDGVKALLLHTIELPKLEGGRVNDQAYFWTPEWQEMEAEADADLAAGRYADFGDMDELIEALKEES